MTREKYPEKVPFRLTRMMVKAMEVSGVEGNYRFTCQSVLRVCREHKDSLMAMLEAFVHDPLINWRLVSTPAAKETVGANNVIRSEDGHADGGRSRAESVEVRPAHPNAPGDPAEGEVVPAEVLNGRALEVIERIEHKLTGNDFGTAKPLTVPEQVDRLIRDATSQVLLASMYVGFCSFW